MGTPPWTALTRPGFRGFPGVMGTLEIPQVSASTSKTAMVTWVAPAGNGKESANRASFFLTFSQRAEGIVTVWWPLWSVRKRPFAS